MGRSEGGRTEVPPGAIEITLVWAEAPHRLAQHTLQMPAGATAYDALLASGVLDGIDAALRPTLSLAIWGRNCTPETPLKDGDRVELLRPLQVDPKEARRLRYRRDAGGRSMTRGPRKAG